MALENSENISRSHNVDVEDLIVLSKCVPLIGDVFTSFETVGDSGVRIIGRYLHNNESVREVNLRFSSAEVLPQQPPANVFKFCHQKMT